MIVELVEISEDGNDERLNDVFCELSSLLSTAVPHEVSVDDFMEAVAMFRPFRALLTRTYVVAEVTGTRDAQADSSSDKEDRLPEVLTTRAY